MRRGLTLIELLISVVIIALVFTVVPKVIFAINKSLMNAGKQDGIFNAVQLMHTISSSPWDKGSYETYSILNVDDGNPLLDCNASGYRIGGFIGGRNCLDVDVNATAQEDFDDSNLLSIGWFDTKDINASSNCTSNAYDLNPVVEYERFAISGNDINLSSFIPVNDTNSSNVKKVSLSVSLGKSGQTGCLEFDYYSANLGQIGILRKEY